ncbi:hypothetical protein Golob_004231 [Gossypium lobatum]|uniref:Uncharacterized protein n=1 Tax=Gossypium lobatum TaxID=34289 RepID=A0A7J8N113_9ROSI|nr:hypothetical protein [Gossypium lobatum]
MLKASKAFIFNFFANFFCLLIFL